ncbi:histone acetylation protein-domain-containing protein [Multifurca ochricompacta]|uniref:histone acetyltransferase n=1 Tax=Multifurca ochricompacta TaxID=376703 RepID=A0AAD4M4A2_9AGAM|nr:histone acetylation protein-domain-containing protein [Multifurca ochricompacta]
MGSASLADILIALSMCWCLYHKKTGFANLNSGLLTSVLATATLICFVVVPTTLIWQAFFWPLGKCYVNSLLAMLNNRDVLRERSANSNSDSSFGMTSLHIARQSEIRQSKRSPATGTMNFRDHILNALNALPGVREFHVHVLVTAPAKDNSLYPYASSRPRLYAQDILVLLSEQANPDSPRVLVSAIEACLYHAPATDCAILYVSKVDSTGQGLTPSPTATLVRAFTRWYADPATRPLTARHLWIQLFARAQGQYLFPNSSDYPGKRPLSDARLCAWWRRVLGQVGADVQEAMGSEGRVDMYYLLPGHNKLEAQQVMGCTSFLSNSPPPATMPPWVYGHPYSQTSIPLPCPPPEGLHNLGHYIPSFEDDPKNRFMDEIAFTDTPISPRKRARTSATRDGVDLEPREGEKEREREKGARPRGELSKVCPDEFWERMSFRQECVTGAVTGFFSLGVSLPEHRMPSQRPPPLAPQPGQVPRAMNRRILSSLLTGVEFSTTERARKATDLIESAVRGLCEGLAPKLPGPKSKNQCPEGAQGSLTPLLPQTPPKRTVGLPAIDDASPNPFDEPEATLETYKAYIFGSINVSNPPLLPKGSGGTTTSEGVSGTIPEDKVEVHVLAVRKKKKRPVA